MGLSSDVFPGWEWAGAARKRERMEARGSWNQFKWYHSAPPFFQLLLLLHLPFHLPLFQPHSLLVLAVCAWLIPLFCKALQERQRILYSKEYSFALTVNLLLFTHLSALFLHQLYSRKTSGVAAHIGRVCWHISEF